MDESGDGGELKEKMKRLVLSLDGGELKQLAELAALKLSSFSRWTAERYKRRLHDHRLYGSDLLQERIVSDLSQHHPLWKKHGLHTVTSWQQWCNHVDDTIGEQMDQHIAKLWPTGPPFYSKLAVTRRLHEGATSMSEAKNILLNRLLAITKIDTEHGVAEFVALERATN